MTTDACKVWLTSRRVVVKVHECWLAWRVAELPRQRVERKLDSAVVSATAVDVLKGAGFPSYIYMLRNSL